MSLFFNMLSRLVITFFPDGQHRNQIDYILCSQRWWSSIQSAKTRLGADCGSDHENFIAKFRLKLKKVWKTTRPFRYDLNQVPCDYTVEVRNRFKGLDLTECLKNYGQGFLTVYRPVRLFRSPWTVAHQAPWSVGFSRQEYWSGLPFSSPGHLPNPGIEPRSPTLQEDSLPSEPSGKLKITGMGSLSLSLLQGIFPT